METRIDDVVGDTALQSIGIEELEPQKHVQEQHEDVPPERALPWRVATSITVLQLGEAWNILLPFPFLVFMVSDSLHINDPKMVGLYAGIIGSLWSLAQCLTAVFYGWASDKYGRRSPLLVGTLGSAFAAIGFGTSTSVRQACVSRFLGGLLSGNIAILKTVLGDLNCGARGFSLMSLAWGLGSILAPSIGGILSRPSDYLILSQNIPGLFGENALFSKFPYLLPCLSQFAIGLVGFTTAFFCLPETRWLDSEDRADGFVRVAREEDVDERQSAWLSDVSSEDDDDQEASNLEPTSSVFEKDAVMRTTSNYGLIALAWVIQDETYPLFAASPAAAGGLGFTAPIIGATLAFSGTVLIVYQMLIYPLLTERYGLKRLFRWGAFSGAVTFALFPFCAHAFSLLGPVCGWVSIGSLLFARTLTACTCFTSIMILQNQAAGSGAERGTVNGVGQMFATAARSLGPFLGGAMWSFALHHEHIPGHQWLPFLTSAVVVIVAGMRCH
ncbi:putative peptide/nitrate transporter [Porphyridium purpureum]|uniref:Putative peptide/nitrate transporter n=1 Tax=Porphyridium purpureum TaxID=35688 RepID=A0A5J4Z0V8_PORPP|nr:putative peptide/nitrate transporter [Porphyridium purpureum]|eukprot:POR9609..scf208_2